MKRMIACVTLTLTFTILPSNNTPAQELTAVTLKQQITEKSVELGNMRLDSDSEQLLLLSQDCVDNIQQTTATLIAEKNKGTAKKETDVFTQNLQGFKEVLFQVNARLEAHYGAETLGTLTKLFTRMQLQEEIIALQGKVIEAQEGKKS